MAGVLRGGGAVTTPADAAPFAAHPRAVADPLPWATYLTALEEWTRRVEAVVRGADDALTAFTEEPDGPLPEGLALRARALLAHMRQLEDVGARRRVGLERARAYEQG